MAILSCFRTSESARWERGERERVPAALLPSDCINLVQLTSCSWWTFVPIGRPVIDQPRVKVIVEVWIKEERTCLLYLVMIQSIHLNIISLWTFIFLLLQCHVSLKMAVYVQKSWIFSQFVVPFKRNKTNTKKKGAAVASADVFALAWKDELCQRS